MEKYILFRDNVLVDGQVMQKGVACAVVTVNSVGRMQNNARTGSSDEIDVYVNIHAVMVMSSATLRTNGLSYIQSF